MIISALVKRYEDTLDVPVGWEKRKVSYALDIDENGKLLSIIPLKETEQLDKKEFKLPTCGKGRSGSKAFETVYFLCDDGNYMLGLDSKKFESCKKFYNVLLSEINEPVAKAICAYFNREPQDITPHCIIKKPEKATYMFFFGGKYIDVENEEMRKIWDAYYVKTKDISSVAKTRCFVTGNYDSVVPLHNKVALRGITMGKQPLIAMNDQQSFRSYGASTKDPPAKMGENAAFAYSAALNGLLSSPKHNKPIGNDTLVFWAEKGMGEEEKCIMELLMDKPKEDDDTILHSTMDAISNGNFALDIDPTCQFYLLCLSPNAARIQVRFFFAKEFGDLIKNIQAHYNRLKIAGDRGMLQIWRILGETTIKKKASDAHPLLGGQLLRAILTDSKYPLTLYNAMLSRIQAGEEINYVKAGVVRAVLIKNFNESEVTTVALNKESASKPYVLGRLFATLEHLQFKANGSAIIRERYFNSACANPCSVFATILNLSVHHAAKLSNDVFFEKLKGELIAKLDEANPFPPTLTLEERGKFIVGYYHQRQDFFTKKDSLEGEDNE